MSNTARLNSLEKWRAERPPARFVIVIAADPTWREHVPGSIDPGDKCCTMVVPAEYESDPELGLSDEQRAWLRPGDQLDVWCYEDLGDDSARAGDIERTWDGTQGVENDR